MIALSEPEAPPNDGHFRALLEGAGDVFFRIEAAPHPRLAWVSDSIEGLLGWTAAEVLRVRNPLDSMAEPSELARLGPALAGLLHTPRHFSAKLVSATGAVVWAEIRTRPRRGANGVIRVDGHVRDITATRAAELSHRELVTHFPGAIAVHRPREIVFANLSLQELTGYGRDQLLGRAFAELVPEDDRPLVRQRIETFFRDGTAWRWEGRLRRQDGCVVLVDVTTIPFTHEGTLAALTLVRDVTESKRVQQQLMIADRMSSVGTLAGGVAHEINNPLAYVISNLAFVQDQIARLPPGATCGDSWQDVLAAVRDSREGVDRVRRIVRDLRMIAQADEQRGAVDVRRVLDSCLNLAWIDVRHRTRLVKDFADVPMVEGNEARLSQVFLNLIMNAMQAMSGSAEGANELRVAVRPVRESVEISIQDTGTGIAPGVLPRIFDPFFSTKPGGVGTGLGLSICHAIVNSLGGSIRATSELGRGTSVTVVLPGRPSSGSPISVGARRARLLLLDHAALLDETSFHVLGARHDVETASGYLEARERVEKGQHDLILCRWPNHAELYDAIVAMEPALKSRFFLLVPFSAKGQLVPPGVRALRYQGRLELDVLLPTLRDAIGN